MHAQAAASLWDSRASRQGQLQGEQDTGGLREGIVSHWHFLFWTVLSSFITSATLGEGLLLKDSFSKGGMKAQRG